MLRQVTVNKNDAGQRLDRFISKTFPDLPMSMMYKLIRTKDIKVNGKRAQISTRLENGDSVAVYADPAFLSPAAPAYPFLTASKQLDIVYEDKNIMLLDKKVGLLSHPDETEYNDTLISRVQRRLYEKGEYDPADENSFAPALANRIDRNTGGIVMAAKNAEALRILNSKIKDREIKKFYLCVLIGCPDRRDGILEGWLVKDEAKNKVTVTRSQKPGALEIRTKYRILGTRDGLSLCEVELLTGRTHQIRAHFASIGCPLLGDGKYGTNELNKKYGGYKKQCLYSYKLQFAFTADAGELSYLDGREFEVKDVWFRQAFLDGTL